MQKAVTLTSWHPQGFRGLRVEQCEAPMIMGNSEDVLVKMILRPINPADISLIQGRMGRPSLPLVPGAEGVGVVQACGSNVKGLKPGQRVVCIPSKAWSALDGSGTWQQVMSVPWGNLYPVPDDVTDEQAAQFAVNPLTVWGLLLSGLPHQKLQAEAYQDVRKWVINSAGGSALGRQMIAVAKHEYGLSVVAVVRRSDQKDELLAAGAGAVIATDGSDGDVAEAIRKKTGGDMVVGAFDCVGGEVTRAVVAATNPSTSTLIYGALGGPTININTLDIFLKKSIKPFLLREFLGNLDMKSHGQSMQEVCTSVMKLIQDGVIKLPSGKRYPLEDVQLAAAESLKTGGKEKVFLEG
ncbi:g3203 [Coccomyxa elongata]